MGLERITTVMQGVQSNYDTDLLRNIIAFIEQLCGKTYGDDSRFGSSGQDSTIVASIVVTKNRSRRIRMEVSSVR
jgi:alanyl-tRNA synthetase